MMSDFIVEAGLGLTDYLEVIKFWMGEYKKKVLSYYLSWEVRKRVFFPEIMYMFYGHYRAHGEWTR